MSMSLDGAVAIVTVRQRHGRRAREGPGRRRRQGHGHGRPRRQGQALADELGDSVMYRHLDVTDAAGWETVVAQTEEAWGPVKVLVNNAGIVMFGPIETLAPS